jgi:hypothetical protein
MGAFPDMEGPLMDSTWFWFGWLIVGIVVAIICARIASGKGRGPVGYALLGFFLPLIGLIVVAVVSKKNTAISS